MRVSLISSRSAQATCRTVRVTPAVACVAFSRPSLGSARPSATVQPRGVRAAAGKGKDPQTKVAKVAKARKAPEPEEPLEVTVKSDGENMTLTIKVPASRCEAAYRATLTHVRGNTTIPGFRNVDKAPDAMLIKAAGGSEQFAYACIEHLISATMPEAFEGRDEGLLDGSQKLETEIENMHKQFDRSRPFTYVCSAAIGQMGLGFQASYEGFTIEVDAPLNQAREDEELKKAIRSVLKQHGGQLKIAERGMQQGDKCTIGFQVKYADSGDLIPGMERGRHELDCDELNSFLIPAVQQAMQGMQAGSAQDIPFEFPDYWEPEVLRGQKAIASVQMTEVFEWQLPELTLEVCKEVLPDVESVEGFEEKAREAIQFEGSNELQTRIQSEILDQLASIVTIDRYPETSYNAFALGQYEQELTQGIESGSIPQDQVESLSTHEAAGMWVEGRTEFLKTQFRLIVALDEIFKREQLAVDEALLDAQVQSHLSNAVKAKQEVDRDEVEEHVRNELRNVSVLAFLQEKANITVKPLMQLSQ